ncbi:MAG: tetratricopeptide repeat protein [bacterium]|nr:tetratricopeptide repeat protein [bacterium]
MQKPDNQQLPIARIGGPRRSALRLRGAVLELTESGWTGDSTSLIPVEWLTVTRQESNRNRLASRAIVAVAAVVMTVSIPALVLALSGADLVPLSLWSVVAALALSAGVASVVMTLRKTHSTVVIYVEAEPEPWRIEFWHAAGGAPALETLISKLEAVQKETERDETPPPLQTTYSTYRIHPVRVVLMRTIGITLIITGPVIAIAWYFHQPLVLLVVLAPALFYFGRLGLSTLFWRRAPFVYREAVRRFESGKYDEAHRLISKVLDDFPDALPAHLLSVQIDLRRGQFDRAMRGCHDVSRLDDDAGQELLEEVWAVKRLRDRMDVEL